VAAEQALVAAQSPVGAPYDLYTTHGWGNDWKLIHLCGHDDPFFLIGKALQLSRIYNDGMTPNVQFHIAQEREYKGSIIEGQFIIQSGFRLF
jgi:hypothetical protein